MSGVTQKGVDGMTYMWSENEWVLVPGQSQYTGEGGSDSDDENTSGDRLTGP